MNCHYSRRRGNPIDERRVTLVSYYSRAMQTMTDLVIVRVAEKMNNAIQLFVFYATPTIT
jgi:hypothetical protein